MYKVQILQDQLEETDRDQQRARIREQALIEAVQIRQRRIAELETAQLELGSRAQEERKQWIQTADEFQKEQKDLRSEIQRLQGEIEYLKEELGETRSEKSNLEAKCVELEERLAVAEASADSGTESRDLDSLERAQKEAEDAKTELNALKEELARLRSTEAPKAANFPHTAADQLQNVADLTPQQVTKTILLADLRADQIANHRLVQDIGRSYPLGRLVEVLKALRSANNRWLIQILIAMAKYRSPSEIFTFITEYGAEGAFGSEALQWFAQKRTGNDFFKMLEIFRAHGMTSEVDEMFLSAAARKDPEGVEATMDALGGSDFDTFVDYIATQRRPESMPTLITQLQDSHPETTATIIYKMYKMRPSDTQSLHSVLSTLDMEKEARLMESIISRFEGEGEGEGDR
ncbi:coiled-coil domain-containing protein [Actinacidiphila bryophytorum]|nr:hypothetical protein [Actinacidiphila bryophytorum]MBM9438723.1 hypothetical protein [Actinacidiphila bryophytorum]MBN6545546.1 hypothetical protein [Actinacidiphila bryophytorum]